MLAKDVMNPNVITVRKDTPVKEIARIMLEKDISGLPVVDRNENVIGVVSELDLMRKQIAPDAPSIWTTLWGKNNDGMQKYVDDLRKYMGKTAEEVMTAPALTVDIMDSLEKIGHLMFNKQIKRVFVTKDGRLAGVVSRSAFLKLLLEEDQNP